LIEAFPIKFPLDDYTLRGNVSSRCI